MRTKIITAAASGTQTVVAESAYQYDWGLRLEVTGLELPGVTEWQFSNDMSGKAAETTLGDSTGVDIPNDLLISGEHVYAWLFLHSTVNDGYTVYTFDIPVIQRTRPVEEEPTPEQAGLISQAIAALNQAVEDTTQAAADASASEQSAAASAESANTDATSAHADMLLAHAAAESASGSAAAAYASEIAARDYADDAETAADRAETAADNVGFVDMEIVNGRLMYYRTDAVDVDFELVDGHLIMEAI